MAECFRVNNTFTPTTPSTTTDYVIELAEQIIAMQNLASRQSGCVSCTSTLNDTLNNTKPVSFILCGGETFEAQITAPTGASTTYFRIEEVLNNSFLKLRLLTDEGATLTCTNQTCLLRATCVCGINCFEGIFCDICGVTQPLPL